jgi:Domain of unknown function (DUF4126)
VDLFLAISQGTGLALATGLRPFLPPLLAGALARADAGLDFSGSDYSFLESIPFLAALVLAAAAAITLERAGRARVLAVSLAALAIVLGALEFAGSLAGEDHSAGAGLPAGAALALLGYAAAAAFLGRARGRLAARSGPETASYLTVYADGAALVLAALAITVPPASYAVVALCGWFLVERRRRASRKYEGLRVLR